MRFEILPRRARERLAFWALVLGVVSLPLALLVGWLGLVPAVLGLAGFAWTGRAALGERALAAPALEPELPRVAPRLRVAACVACDEAMLGLMQMRTRVPCADTIALVASELERGLGQRAPAHDPLERRPPALVDFELEPLRVRGERILELCAESGWSPAAGEPGVDRWLSCEANRWLRAAVLRHPGAPRPWLICLHGYRMGQHELNLRLFDPLRLHRGLGLNLLVPVLPLHGVRRAGERSGDHFLDGRFVETHHALCQSVWELRRMIGWARAQGAPAVGLYGVSLGAVPAALAATLEADLDLVLLGVPLADVTDALWRHAPPPCLDAFASAGVTRALAERWLAPVSPLARTPKVPPERLALYAAAGDRIVPPHHAALLWERWGRPPLEWLDAGHLTFFADPRFRRFETRVLSRLAD